MTDREHDQLLATATDRFERRLSEEMAAVRITMVEQDSITRQEIAGLRVEMVELKTATRQEIANVRIGMSEQFASSRVDSEARHRELLKWAFVFWVGQAAVVAGIVTALT